MQHKQLPFQSEEEWYLFLEYVRLIHEGITKVYNFNSKNFIGRCFVKCSKRKKQQQENFEIILNLTDKLIVTLRNEEGITLKTIEDVGVFMYLTDIRQSLVKLVLLAYKLTDKETYEKLVSLLSRMHLILITE